MYKNVYLLVFLSVTSSAIPSAVLDKEISCSSSNSTYGSQRVFRCQNGTDCIDIRRQCDGVIDCADGSDEALCAHHSERTFIQRELHRSKRQFTCGQGEVQCPDGSCVLSANECRIGEACALPPYPKHGTYRVQNDPKALPGHVLPYARMTLSCQPGYGLLRSDVGAYGNRTREVLCVNGKWEPNILPQCVPFCSLVPDPSVKYNCRVPGSSSFARCERYVPSGTTVNPQCNTPVYYSHKSLLYMTCRNGQWDNVAKCEADCGRVTPEALELVSNGRIVMRGELPWHVGIYAKTATPYRQICGGSLVSNNVVISAAHCFWSDVGGKIPASNFAVASGKRYRTWLSKDDKGSQESNVKDIMIPDHFQGTGSILQADVAVLILETPFVYKPHIKPVCLSFNKDFDKFQLQDGKTGKVAGWGLTSANGPASEELRAVNMPYIDYNTCVASVPQSFKQFITIDKFCAGYTTETAVCRGDSGGGLAFAALDQYIERYYLQGVVSAAPQTNVECNVNTYATFTMLSAYYDFIKEAMQVRSVVSKDCPASQFQCSDGTCVSHETNCNQVQACVTGTERSCNIENTFKIPGSTTSGTGVTPPQELPSECGVPDTNGPEAPWHVGIYRKTTTPYKHVCGGSLVTNNLVVSAAHCFWNDALKKLPASHFAVAAGKTYRPWNNPNDIYAQKSNVKSIQLPERFQGARTDFTEDVAILILESQFVFTVYVKPVCLNFDTNLDGQQLQTNQQGKVAGWGATSANGPPSPVLKIVRMPYVESSTCRNSFPPAFLSYFTADKFCAGGSGTFLCPGDGGGGLAFSDVQGGIGKYYLRGVVSAAPVNDNKCNVDTYTTFTQITKFVDLFRRAIVI